MASSWSPERVETLKQMWADGHSASRIAALMGGFSRNAIIGKVHRLKLAGRARGVNPLAPKRTRKPRSTAGQRAFNGRQPPPKRRERDFAFANLSDIAALATLIEVAPADRDIEPCPLVELEPGDCHWPIGDPKKPDFGFCGQRALKGRPYCPSHSSRAYRPG